MNLASLRRHRLLLTMAVVIAVGACTDAGLTVREWEQRTWMPLLMDVPLPEDATPEVCQMSLVAIRDKTESEPTAPEPELQEAFEKWSEAAQSLTFECASEAEDFSYVDSYAEVVRLGEQVDRILEGIGG